MTHMRPIYIAAGGTGGHIFPAIALADKLAAQNYDIRFCTDKRGMAYYAHFSHFPVHVIAAGTIFGGRVFSVFFQLMVLIGGILHALYVLLHRRPAVIVGFGGYPSIPPLIAAWLLRVPILIHEQNAYMGRANRLMVYLRAHIATGFEHTAGIPRWGRKRVVFTGNPVRKEVVEATRGKYRFLTQNRPFDLLIFGGSQGAAIFNQVIPEALSNLPHKLRRRLRVTYQSHRRDMPVLLDVFAKANIYTEIRDFFNNMPYRMRRAHLVISRAGASTITELQTLGVPAIVVPFPGSLDQDQAHNARHLVRKGAAWLMLQESFNAARVTAYLEDLMTSPKKLRSAAECAVSLRDLTSADYLADYTLCVARRDVFTRKKECVTL